MEIRISSWRRILKGKWRFLEGVEWNVVPLFKEGFPNRQQHQQLSGSMCPQAPCIFLIYFLLALARGNTILKSEWG